MTLVAFTILKGVIDMTNYYYCPDCNKAWEDNWDSACDDKCSFCGKAYTPFDSKEDWLKAQKGKTSKADRLTAKIVIDIKYDLNGTPKEEIEHLLRFAVNHLSNNGMLSGETPAEVDEWGYDLDLQEFVTIRKPD